MILPIVIFVFVFLLSIFWGVFGTNYFLSSLNSSGVVSFLPSEMAYLLFSVAIPILILFMLGLIFYLVYQVHQTNNMFLYLSKLLKTQSSMMQIIGKSIIEVRKLGFTSQFFINLPVIFNDMSLFVAKIISKLGIESDLVIEDSLLKSQDIRLSAVCKILLSKREATPHFSVTLRRVIKQNEELQGLIALFIEKYDKLVKALKEYDIDNFTYKIVVEGDLGKVYNILVNATKDSDESSLYNEQESIKYKKLFE